MSEYLFRDDPTEQRFDGDINKWLDDPFVSHMFWTYGGSLNGSSIEDMISDVNRLLDGEAVKDGFCKELIETGSRFYYAGKDNQFITQSTDFDYFGSSQMVGIWTIYLYLTGWKLVSSPYHKGVYASYKGSTINLIAIKRTDVYAWMKASIETKSYIIDKEKQFGPAPSLSKHRAVKREYLKEFIKSRNSVDMSMDDRNLIAKTIKSFNTLDKLTLTYIKKRGQPEAIPSSEI